MTYTAAAMTSGFYAFEAVEKGKTSLPTGLEYSSEKGIAVGDTFTAAATISIRLANNTE